MKRFSFLILMLVPCAGVGQQHTGGAVLNIDDLVNEALRNNTDIQASRHQVDAAYAGIPRAGALDDPELTYMREEMPGFRWNRAEMQKIELMQMIRFPSKSAARTDLAEIQFKHAHHDYEEKELEVIAKLKSAYAELWFVQHALALNRENARLLQQFASIAKTKFGVGEARLQEVLKVNVERARLENQATVLRQQEQSVKAMLCALLNRPEEDTLGIAGLPDTVSFTATLDTLLQLGVRSRPMLLHDSLAVEESRTVLSLSKQEYLPDIKVGVQYVTVPVGDFRGWSVSAGITLPFAPWTLGKAGSRVEEAAATIGRSEAALNATRNMVLSGIRDLYYKAVSARDQLHSYHTFILPQAEMSSKASVTAYRNAKENFLMLIDSYRTSVELAMEALMLRVQFEQAVADLERQVGTQNVTSIERKDQ
jgi:outer membrane protein TolC